MLEIQKKNKKSRWKYSEKAFLIENAGRMSDRELSENLNKTIKAVREMRSRLGLKKKRGRGIIALEES